MHNGFTFVRWERVTGLGMRVIGTPLPGRSVEVAEWLAVSTSQLGLWELGRIACRRFAVVPGEMFAVESLRASASGERSACSPWSTVSPPATVSDDAWSNCQTSSRHQRCQRISNPGILPFAGGLVQESGPGEKNLLLGEALR